VGAGERSVHDASLHSAGTRGLSSSEGILAGVDHPARVLTTRIDDAPRMRVDGATRMDRSRTPCAPLAPSLRPHDYIGSADPAKWFIFGQDAIFPGEP